VDFLPQDADGHTSNGSFAQSARLYYVFGFVSGPVPLDEEVKLATQDNVQVGKLIASHLHRAQHYMPDPHGVSAWHLAEEKEPRESRAALYLRFDHLSVTTRHEEVQVTEVGRGTVETHIVLFKSGLGVAAVSVKIPQALDPETLARFMRRDTLPVVESNNDEGEVTQRRSVHQIFVQEVEHFLRNVNDALELIDREDSVRLASKYRYGLLESGNDARSAERDRSNQERFQLQWIDQPSDMVWAERTPETAEIAPSGIFQEPCVAMLLKVAPGIRDVVGGDSERRAEVESILYRLLHALDAPDSIADSRSRRPKVAFKDLYPGRRFRLFLQSGRLVVLHSESWDDLALRRLCMGLFRIFVALRGYWHYYVVTSEVLDRVVGDLFFQFTETISRPRGTIDLLRKQEEVINTKARFLRSLAIEDPLLHGVGLTPFDQLYSEGSRFLGLVKIRDLVRFKLSELDKLFEMIASYRLRREYEGVPQGQQWTRNAVLLLLGSTVCSIGYYLLIRLTPAEFAKSWAGLVSGGFILLLAVVCFLGFLLTVIVGRPPSR